MRDMGCVQISDKPEAKQSKFLLSDFTGICLGWGVSQVVQAGLELV